MLQQLLTDKQNTISYWFSESNAEVNFLVQMHGKVFPVEVKAKENLQAKSLRFYAHKYEPLMAIRTSMTDYYKQEWMINVPLYAILELSDLLEWEIEAYNKS